MGVQGCAQHGRGGAQAQRSSFMRLALIVSALVPVCTSPRVQLTKVKLHPRVAFLFACCCMPSVGIYSFSEVSPLMSMRLFSVLCGFFTHFKSNDGADFPPTAPA